MPMLEYVKTPPTRLEVRIHGPSMIGTLGWMAIFLSLVSIGLGVGLGNWLYYILAVVFAGIGVALRRIYGGRVMYIEKQRGKVRLAPGVSEKGLTKQEWPEAELTEARLYTRQVFVGKEKETRYIVGATRRNLKPTPLIETESLEEAIDFSIRLCRVLKCDFVDATLTPPGRLPADQIAELRKKLTAEAEEGERVPRPNAITRRRKGGGYEYRWQRENASGLTTYSFLCALLLLGPVYVVQASSLLWPLLLWIPGAGMAYLGFFEWATLYTLSLDAQGIEYIDGKRASESRKLKWELIRGLKRVEGRGKSEFLDVKTLRPFKVYCPTAACAAYLEEQFNRYYQRYVPST